MPQEFEEEVNMIDRHVFEPIYKNPEAIGKTGRVFWFSRHGESENNLFGKIGGDTSLSTNGEKYATLLAAYINQMELDDLQVNYLKKLGYIYVILDFLINNVGGFSNTKLEKIIGILKSQEKRLSLTQMVKPAIL